jgi:hypothetical protein
MSKKLLSNLNGNKTGHLKKFIDEFNGEPRIAWYPSAGVDFRPLLYLHPKFSELYPTTGQEPPAPDLFLFTDYNPFLNLTNKTIHTSQKTILQIEYIEELPRLNLPIHVGKIIDCPGSILTDRSIFLKIKVISDRLGTFIYHVLYSFAENEAFFCNKLIPNKATITHIIRVNYGNSLGGGLASGAWLLNVLKDLNCELFITDGRLYWNKGDEYAFNFCSSIPKNSNVLLTKIRNQRNGWATLTTGEGNYHYPTPGISVKDGHVNWYLVT